MTDEQIDAMQAGLELEQLVAKVIGLHEDWGPDGFRSFEDDEGNPAGGPFSREWDAAIFAAERFGLFTRHQQVLGHDGLNYCLAENGQPISQNFDGTKAASGQLAICRAILRLAEKA